jgi:hypothetical protein
MFEYCSVKCQRVHWKSGGHKSECANIAAAARSLGSPEKKNQVGNPTDGDHAGHLEETDAMAAASGTYAPRTSLARAGCTHDALLCPCPILDP